VEEPKPNQFFDQSGVSDWQPEEKMQTAAISRKVRFIAS
jgi:hypothetical protein